MTGRHATFALALLGAILAGNVSPAFAGDRVIGPMPWMTQFMPTWNPAAPKVVSDGLHHYAAVCCVDSPTSWTH